MKALLYGLNSLGDYWHRGTSAYLRHWSSHHMYIITKSMGPRHLQQVCTIFGLKEIFSCYIYKILLFLEYSENLALVELRPKKKILGGISFLYKENTIKGRMMAY